MAVAKRIIKKNGRSEEALSEHINLRTVQMEIEDR